MMMKKKPLAVLMGQVFGLVALAATGVAQAQQATPERITVTGSRISSPNAESPSPLQVFSAEDIASSGVTNVQELLLKNPTMGVPSISRTNSNFQTASVGVATIDLRNLGTARTLVLVNGRRFVSGQPGTSAVDMNSIPTDFIERIDMLTGGASSTYGSDAVAGVVNIILKRNFEGISLDASRGESNKGDDTKQKFGVTFGTAGEKGNVMGHFGYSKQGAVYSRDREMSSVDQGSQMAFVTGDPADAFTVVRPNYSSFAPQGRFFYTGGSYTYDANGNPTTFSTNGTANHPANGFNRSEFRTIAVPTERYIFAATGNYALSENHSAFFEGNYAATKVNNMLEPFPISSTSASSAISTMPIPAEFKVNGVTVRNPIVPDYLYSRLTDTNGDGLKDYTFTRRLSEIGNRGGTVDRDTFRVATGLKGSIFKDWNYEVFTSYGSTKESQVTRGQVNVSNFLNALSAIPNGNGGAMCLDANARNQGCVPISVFGLNSITPEAAKYVQAPGSLATAITQKIVGGSVNGEPFMLPAGPVAVAAGYEWREETSRSEADALTQAGLNAGNASPATYGDFTVKEVFLEARVPILKNAPFAKSLSFLGAARWGDYSTVGNTTSWNGGLEWALNSDVKFRATRALSTRAPNINELFAPAQQNFPSGLVDPCLGVTATSQGAKDAACRAHPGVAANIAANGAFTLTQADLQGISGYDRGNPKVKEEKGRSWTAGIILTPKSIPVLDKFSFTADYFKIQIADAIVSTPYQFALDSCYGGDVSFCQFITRRTTAGSGNNAGSLLYVDSAVSNSGGMETSGIDLTANYSDRLGPGRLNARLAYTHLKRGYVIPLPGAAPDAFAGEIGAAKDKASLALGYKWGDFGVNLMTTYIGESSLDDQFLISNGAEPGSVKIGAKMYNDLQVTYNLRKQVELYLGIDNLFDTKAPMLPSGLPGSDTGTETNAGTYDAIGRRYYVGVRLRM